MIINRSIVIKGVIIKFINVKYLLQISVVINIYSNYS